MEILTDKGMFDVVMSFGVGICFIAFLAVATALHTKLK